MTIVVRRRTGTFARVRRFRVELDGRTEARLRHDRTVELTGSGAPQQLSVSIDWVSSNPLTVVDPGPTSVLEIEVSRRGMTDTALRTWLAPKSVLTLTPAGQPAPPPPPLRLGPRKILTLWLLAVAWITLLTVTVNHTLDPATIAGTVTGMTIALALLLTAVTLILRHHRSTLK